VDRKNQSASQITLDTLDLKKNIQILEPELKHLVELFYFKAYTQQIIANNFILQ